MKVANCTLLKPLHCSNETNIAEAAKILRDNKQRRIIIVDERMHPVGIISTTDINNKVVAENGDTKSLKAKDIMTSPIYLVCDINDDLSDLYRKMHMHESYFCPVVKDKKLIGVLTFGELMKNISVTQNAGKIYS